MKMKKIITLTHFYFFSYACIQIYYNKYHLWSQNGNVLHIAQPYAQLY